METRIVNWEFTEVPYDFGRFISVALYETRQILVRGVDGTDTVIAEYALPTDFIVFEIPRHVLASPTWSYYNVLCCLYSFNLDQGACHELSSCISEAAVAMAAARGRQGFFMNNHVEVVTTESLDEAVEMTMLLGNHNQFLLRNGGDNIADPSSSNMVHDVPFDSNVSVSEFAASDSVLEWLKKERKVKFQNTKDKNEVDDCAICLVEFSSEEQLIEIPCSHIFHESCVFRWLKQKNSCPLCRRAVSIPCDIKSDS